MCSKCEGQARRMHTCMSRIFVFLLIWCKLYAGNTIGCHDDRMWILQTSGFVRFIIGLLREQISFAIPCQQTRGTKFSSQLHCNSLKVYQAIQCSWIIQFVCKLGCFLLQSEEPCQLRFLRQPTRTSFSTASRGCAKIAGFEVRFLCIE